MSKKLCDCGKPAIRKDGACRRCADLESKQLKIQHKDKPVVATIFRPGEISFKQWAMREAQRFGMSVHTFEKAVARHKFILPDCIRRGPSGRAIAVTDPNAKSILKT